MIFKQFLRGEKTVTDAGKWGMRKFPKTGGPFPLSKTKSVRLGDQWETRVVKLELDGHQYVMLIGVQHAKQEMLAYLGARIGDNSLVLARLEYHATHPGVHIHSCCGTHEPGWMSRTGHPGLKRIPAKARQKHNTMLPLITTDVALRLVAEKFRISGLLTPEDDDPQADLFKEST